MPTFLDHRSVKTRKQHQCWGCARMIPAGSQMDVTVSVDMGSASSAYWCLVCQDVTDQIDRDDIEDGIGLGDYRSEYSDLWEESLLKIEGEK